MLEERKKVFIDANIFIKAGKPPGGPLIKRLKDLADAGFIDVLTTNLTCQEVAKKYTESDYDVIKEVGRPHFRRLIKDVLGTKLPDINKTELKYKLTEIKNQSTEAMLIELNCEWLDIDNVKPSIVFSDYAAGERFFTSTGKKDQFPDAFIFECIKAEASREVPVIIVSEDGDFDKPVESEDHISLVKSLPDLFKTLGLQTDAPEVESFLTHHKDELIEAVDRELDNWGLVDEVEDGEITEMDVTDVEIIELISFGPTEKENPILVVGQLSVNVNVSYTHPNWNEAVYDSEDKCYILFDYIRGVTDISIEVDVSMSLMVDKDGTPNDINEMRFRSGEFQYIQLYPFYPNS